MRDFRPLVAEKATLSDLGGYRLAHAPHKQRKPKLLRGETQAQGHIPIPKRAS